MADEAEVVLRNADRDRYEIWIGDALAGFSVYQEDGDRTAFIHTEVDPAFGGRGLGTVLARGALDDAVGRGRVIVPLCPFIARYLRKNSGYEEHVRWPDDVSR